MSVRKTVKAGLFSQCVILVFKAALSIIFSGNGMEMQASAAALSIHHRLRDGRYGPTLSLLCPLPLSSPLLLSII